MLRGQCSGNSKQVEAVGSVPYIASPLNRQLELTTASGVVIMTFTQAEIDAGCVVFVQEGQVPDLDRTLGPAVVTPCLQSHRLLCR
ncbi:MAG: hypothetical protein CAF42_009485 [Nitrospira sp. CG24B]|nr:MAG: hypothetical protein CAF42_009485 [Nitrospira sp. CG24B]